MIKLAQQCFIAVAATVFPDLLELALRQRAGVSTLAVVDMTGDHDVHTL